jgi:hypothetical protein
MKESNGNVYMFLKSCIRQNNNNQKLHIDERTSVLDIDLHPNQFLPQAMHCSKSSTHIAHVLWSAGLLQKRRMDHHERQNLSELNSSGFDRATSQSLRALRDETRSCVPKYFYVQPMAPLKNLSYKMTCLLVRWRTPNRKETRRCSFLRGRP